MRDAAQAIQHFQLSPLPGEGGYFRQTFRDEQSQRLVSGLGGRAASTAIYYLITERDFSKMHVLRFPEVWHYYAGTGPAKMLQIDQSGNGSEYLLGSDFLQGQVPQLVVPAGCWQGTRLVGAHGWALFGCTVAPGFEFSDCTLGSAEDLAQLFPGLRAQWERYC